MGCHMLLAFCIVDMCLLVSGFFQIQCLPDVLDFDSPLSLTVGPCSLGKEELQSKNIWRLPVEASCSNLLVLFGWVNEARYVA